MILLQTAQSPHAPPGRRRQAIEILRDQQGQRAFADSGRAGKNHGVRQAVLFDGTLQYRDCARIAEKRVQAQPVFHCESFCCRRHPLVQQGCNTGKHFIRSSRSVDDMNPMGPSDGKPQVRFPDSLVKLQIFRLKSALSGGSRVGRIARARP